MSRPVILFYTAHSEHAGWGGDAKYWYETVLNEQFREAFACHVLLADTIDHRERGCALEQCGAKVGWVPSPAPASGIPIRAWRRTVRQFSGRRHDDVQARWKKWIRQCKPDLVWLNLATGSYALDMKAAIDICRESRIPYCLVVQHCFEAFFLPRDSDVRKMIDIVEGATRVVFVADRNQRAFERAIGKKIPNGWRSSNAVSHDVLLRAREIAQSSPVQSDGPARLLSLARFEPAIKGQHILFEILATSKWAQRDWRLTLQGYGDLACYLQSLIRYYELDESRIELRTYTVDPLPVIATSDLLIMPSTSEGTPFAMVESMACGRPAVGTPVGGIPELIIERETGWLAKSTDIASVADALERAWTDRFAWRDYGARAQARVAASYDQDFTIKQLVRALQNDIANHRQE
jgi:glycosyltransferase involved in cell wall biosynthesis